MSANRRKVICTVLAALVIPALVWWILYSTGVVGAPGKPVRPPFNMSDRIATIQIEKNKAGKMVATFEGWEKGVPPLTADQFFAEVYSRQVDLPFLFRFLNVTSVTSLVWVMFGFLAQGVFAGRMLVQLYASEKAGASVVPVVFWWMSLVGASMLIIYFIWRKDIVGVVGQTTGWAVYTRNLWMIYGKTNDCP
jgi:lipid-A-disaccharide synthase-like uncharacterized protein